MKYELVSSSTNRKTIMLSQKKKSYKDVGKGRTFDMPSSVNTLEHNLVTVAMSAVLKANFLVWYFL